MKYYVYLLECKDKYKKISYYCGYTARTPSIRLKDHLNNMRKKKKKHFTGRQEFVKLVYYETYEDKKTATDREREIKKLGSRYKLGLIHGMRNISKKKK